MGKAYQLKVALKNAKPPQWCRCIIPTGITFSQLGVLLLLITKEQATAFEFEFYHRKIRLFEEQRVASRGADFYYEFMGAFETFIDCLLDTQEWFSFNCNSGNYYRITIENRLNDFTDGWANVQKYRGEWGAKEHEVLSITQHINEMLKERYRVSYGAPDYRMSQQIQAEIKQGNYGLQGAIEPINKTDHYQKSTNGMMREIAERLIEKSIFEQKERIKKDSLKNLLTSENMEDLIYYAQELDIRSPSSQNKNELAEKIINHILTPSIMRKRMSVLSDEKITAFEIAIKCGNGFRPQERVLTQLEELYELDYLIIYDDGSISVPDEVIAAYNVINTVEFHTQRKRIVWLQACLEMHAMIYGAAPINILHRMYRKRPGFKVTREEFLDIFHEIPKEMNLCIIRDDKIIVKEILKNDIYLHIEKAQGSKEFYIPNYKEVLDCIENKYPSEEFAYQELKKFLSVEMRLPDADVLDIASTVWNRITLGCDFSDVMDVFNERDINFSSEQNLMTFSKIIMNVNNRTRMLVNRGYMPDELATQIDGLLPNGQMPTIVPMSSTAAEMLGESQKELVERGFTIDLESNAQNIPISMMKNGLSGKMETSSKKVYPNDPCPCSSGKKYKKCCRRG